MNTKWMLYKELELIPDSVPEPHCFRRSVLTKLRAVGQNALNRFICPFQPHVWITDNPHGGLYWHVHDPITHTSACFSSDREVRVWLEQRYYRKPDGWGNGNSLYYWRR